MAKSKGKGARKSDLVSIAELERRKRHAAKKGKRQSGRVKKAAETAAWNRPGKVREVPMIDITLDPEMQARQQIDQDVVLDYRGLYNDGVELPPVVLIDDGEKLYLAEGWHRYQARKSVYAVIRADVRKGTREDAVWFAAQANKTHGLRRTSEDKRRAIDMALRARPKLSDRAIADHVGVHHDTVAARRKILKLDAVQERISRTGGKVIAGSATKIEGKVATPGMKIKDLAGTGVKQTWLQWVNTAESMVSSRPEYGKLVKPTADHTKPRNKEWVSLWSQGKGPQDACDTLNSLAWGNKPPSALEPKPEPSLKPGVKLVDQVDEIDEDEAAYQRYEQGAEARAGEILLALTGKLGKSPGLLASLLVLQQVPAMDEAREAFSNAAEPDKWKPGAKIREAATHAGKASFAGIRELEAMLSSSAGMLDSLAEFPPILELVAEAAGVEVPPRLKLADFKPQDDKVPPYPQLTVEEAKVIREEFICAQSLCEQDKAKVMTTRDGREWICPSAGGGKAADEITLVLVRRAKAGEKGMSYAQHCDAMDRGDVGRGDHDGQGFDFKGERYICRGVAWRYGDVEKGILTPKREKYPVEKGGVPA